MQPSVSDVLFTITRASLRAAELRAEAEALRVAGNSKEAERLEQEADSMSKTAAQLARSMRPDRPF